MRRLQFKGAISATFSLTVFPWLIRTFGIAPLYRITVWIWAPLYALPPVINALASSDGHGAAVWTLMALALVMYAIGDLCFPLNVGLLASLVRPAFSDTAVRSR